MNEVTFTLTVDDLLAGDSQASVPATLRPLNPLRSVVTVAAVAFFFAFAAWLFGPLVAICLVLMPAMPLSLAWLGARQAAAQRLLSAQEAANRRSEPVRVSLTPRGVLESDSVEERLTLWDAITEVQLTDKFLLAKDSRGGLLMIPVRAFGSAAAAKLFQIEMDNHRMRHAVGLSPATSLAAQPTIPVTTATVPQEAPQQQATAGWWRKP
jgi:hypothetical protein